MSTFVWQRYSSERSDPIDMAQEAGARPRAGARRLVITFKRTFRGVYYPIASVIGRAIIANMPGFVPKVVTMVDGGLGSQMWQYALGVGAATRSGLPVEYDLTWFDLYGGDLTGENARPFRILSVFPNVSMTRASSRTVKLYKNFFGAPAAVHYGYSQDIYESRRPRYMGGYYEGAAYIDEIEDDIRKAFVFKLSLSDANERVRAQIEGARCPVAVHVRRGDFVGSRHDVTTPEYFKRCIEVMLGRLGHLRPTFFVFSNGMEWCRELFRSTDADMVYVDQNDNDAGEIDMYLMSLCSHFIISNSGFSWWAAWLSQRENKIVLMPYRWSTDEPAHAKGIMRSRGWEMIEC